MAKMKTWEKISAGLLAVGGLNWGLVGIFGFDLVAYLLGDASVASRVVYTLVGVSAIPALMALFNK